MFQSFRTSSNFIMGVLPSNTDYLASLRRTGRSGMTRSWGTHHGVMVAELRIARLMWSIDRANFGLGLGPIHK